MPSSQRQEGKHLRMELREHGITCPLRSTISKTLGDVHVEVVDHPTIGNRSDRDPGEDDPVAKLPVLASRQHLKAAELEEQVPGQREIQRAGVCERES
jgi:hypothetical protein